MKNMQKYEIQTKELARLVNIEEYVALQLKYITADASFDEIALCAGLLGEMERKYSLYKDNRYAEQYRTILQNIALGFSRSKIGVVPMQILRCAFLFEHFQVVSDHDELRQFEASLLEDLATYNPETLEYPLFATSEGVGDVAITANMDMETLHDADDADDADADAGNDGNNGNGDANANANRRHVAELVANFEVSAKSQARFFYSHIQLYYTRTLLGDRGGNAVRNLVINIAKVYTPKVLSPSGYRQTLTIIFDDILKKDYATYMDAIEETYLADSSEATTNTSMFFAPIGGADSSDDDNDNDNDNDAGADGEASSPTPVTPFWEHAPEVQTSAMLWGFHVLLDHCGTDATVVPRLYDTINTLYASLIKNYTGSVAHLNDALLITYYHRLISDHMAILSPNTATPSNAEDVLQSYIQKNMEPLDTPRNNSSERVLRIGILAYSLPNNEYSALLFKIATHLKLFDEDFAVYLYNEQSFRSSSDMGIEHQFKALLGDNYYSHAHPLYSTFAENAEGVRRRIENDNLDILIFTHMEYTENYTINLKSAPCQVYLSLFDKMYSSSNISATVAVSDGYRQVTVENTVVDTFTIETPLTMTPTTTPDNQLRQLLRGLY